MEHVLGVALFWLAFAGTHVGLATSRVRAALVARLGMWGFIGVFSLVASITYGALVHDYALHRLEGPPGLGLGEIAWLRSVLIAVAVVGVVLATASLYGYPASPYALGNERAREPRGLDRITRHPFFVGVALFGAAHALLASRLVGTVFFGALAIYSILGSAHQDRKLLRLRGQAYGDYLARTSLVPFAAIAAGRQRIAWEELSWIGLGGGVVVAWLLRTVHDSIFAHGGAWVIAATIGGAALAAFQSWRRATRQAARRPRPAHAT